MGESTLHPTQVGDRTEGPVLTGCGTPADDPTLRGDETRVRDRRAGDPLLTRVDGGTHVGVGGPPTIDDPYATRVGRAVDEDLLPDLRARIHAFGDYELLSEIARGGMGVVYRARQVGLNRVVALKMILSGQFASRDEVDRFRIEAEAAAGLDHPNIVPIYEVGEHGDRHYYTMKLVEGGSLATRADCRPFAPREAAEVVATIARAVYHAHRRGILHRDLKPDNVLLDADGRPHITDFGLAKRTEGESGLTHSGAVMGTPSYMPPEQASGRSKTLTVAVDVYSLGAILYYLVAGRPPFRSESAATTLLQVLNEEPRRPRLINPRVAPDLETICLKCLEKEPSRRYESADKLAEDLGRWLRGETISARPATTTERGLKWVRRRPAIAALCAAIFGVSVAGLAGVIYQWRASVANAEKADDLAFVASVEARRAREGEQEAIESRHQARGQLVDLSAASGLAAARRNDHDQALLWFAQAVKLAAGDEEREHVNRIRVRNWDRRVFQPIRDRTVPGFRASQDRFLAFDFHPSGRYLLALTTGGLAPIWDLELDAEVPLPGDPSRRVGAAAWSPDGRHLAVGTPEGRVEILEFPSLKVMDSWESGAGAVTSLAYARDGSRLAIGAHRGARVRDVGGRSFATPLLAHPRDVVGLVFDDPGDRLVTVSLDGKARLFAIGDDATEPVFPPIPQSTGDFGVSHGGPSAVAPRFVDGGRILLNAASYDLHWRRTDTGSILTTRPSPNGGSLTAVNVSPDGGTVVAVWSTTGRTFAAQDGSLAAVITNSDTWGEEAVFSPGGDLLATAGQDTMVRFWSTERTSDFSVRAEHHPLRHPSMVARVRFSGDGTRLAVAQWDGSVRIWKAPTAPGEDFHVPVNGPSRVALSPDGRHAIASGTSFRGSRLVQSRVIDSATGQFSGPTLLPGGVIMDASFSADGRHVAMASSAASTPAGRDKIIFEPDGAGGNVQVWDWATGKRVAGPIGMPTEPRGLAYSPDGKRLAVTCADGWVVLLDMPGGTQARRIDTGVRTRPANANLWWSNGQARFSPDGRCLLTWEMGTDVHVWDAATAEKLFDLHHNGRIESVVFGPEPDLMLTCSRDSYIRIWDLRQGTFVAPPLKHPRWTSYARFSHDGSKVHSCGDDGIFRTWDWRQGTTVSAYHLGEDILTSFDATPDRRWLVTTGIGRTHLSDIKTGAPIAPPLFGAPVINLRVAIPPDGRRAIVAGFSGEMIGYDLPSLLAPAEGPAEELIRRAEVIACQRVYESRELNPLNIVEWQQRWNSPPAAR